MSLVKVTIFTTPVSDGLRVTDDSMLPVSPSVKCLPEVRLILCGLPISFERQPNRSRARDGLK